MLLEVRKFSPGSNRELNQLRSLDVWDEISVATHPDEWTGRRGARLSICEYSHVIFIQMAVQFRSNSTAEIVGANSRYPCAHHPSHKIEL